MAKASGQWMGRYQAELRSIDDKAAVQGLSEGLREPQSALLRQMQRS